MSDVIISVEHLSKRYRLGQIGATTLRESAERLWHRLRGRDPEEHMGKIGRRPEKIEHQGSEGRKGEEIGTVKTAPRGTSLPLLPSVQNSVSEDQELWALKDVSFEVKRGEVLGIIGRNGAGKSTLLKILSRITEPTSGRAVMRGRIASLLEVGTGFHPELTGRENIYLNGAILGMRKREIDSKFDEIVAFSEVERFIDTPVKRYSSGMYVRLAFAVAAHLDPEILLVDEVLAVGDAAFQKKCLGKMGEVAKGGRTVLFVSHNMGAVSLLCESCILLNHGALAEHSRVDQAVSAYMRGVYSSNGQITFPVEESKKAQIIAVSLLNSQGETTSTFAVNDPLVVETCYSLREDISGIHVACIVTSDQGVVVFATADTDTKPELFDVRLSGKYKVRVKLPNGLLNVGTYAIALGIGIPGIEIFDRREAATFTLVDKGDFGSVKEGGRRGGMILVRLPWENVGGDKNAS